MARLTEQARDDRRAQALDNFERLARLFPESPSPEAMVACASEIMRRAVVTGFFIIIERMPVKEVVRLAPLEMEAKIGACRELSEHARKVAIPFMHSWAIRGGLAQDDRKRVRTNSFYSAANEDVDRMTCALDLAGEAWRERT